MSQAALKYQVAAALRACEEKKAEDISILRLDKDSGAFTDQAPGFVGKRVINDKGEKGDANDAVLKVLTDNGMLIARGRLKHQYPHSWRSKKPVIFRNTPQWFIAMDKDIAGEGDTLRHRALAAIKLSTVLRGIVALSLPHSSATATSSLLTRRHPRRAPWRRWAGPAGGAGRRRR